MLEPTGYRIVSAASGTEALRCALAEDFAVILLDVHMPGLGGVETARLLRQRERSRQTPIIFVTASDEELELAREGYEAGGVDYLFKPIKDGRTLQAKVAVFAELYRTTAALRASEENFRMLADFTYDMEYWRLPDGRLVYISPSCERVTGYSQKEFLQDPNLLARIVHPEDRPAMERHFEDSGDTTAGRGYCEMEFRILTRSGEARWIGHVCQQVVGADGKSQGRRATNRDITERKNAEQIIQSMSEMLYSAAL
jgi:PAS domain S-box-containing protein